MRIEVGRFESHVSAANERSALENIDQSHFEEGFSKHFQNY
jgi:hypothetical protein